MIRGMRVTRAVPITPDLLIATSIAEADYPVWDIATAYTKGDRVILDHVVYEAVSTTGNTGKNPADDDGAYWARVGATNRWKAFEYSRTSRTRFDASAYWEIAAGQGLSSVVLRGMIGVSLIRLTLTDPDFGVVLQHEEFISSLPSESSWYAWTFEQREPRTDFEFHGVPTYPNATLRIEAEGANNAGVGVIAVGQQYEFGIGVQLGGSLSLEDFGRTRRTEYGELELADGDYADDQTLSVVIEAQELANVKSLLVSLRNKPSLWSPSDRLSALTVWGRCRRFRIGIPYTNYLDCSLELEGFPSD